VEQPALSKAEGKHPDPVEWDFSPLAQTCAEPAEVMTSSENLFNGACKSVGIRYGSLANFILLSGMWGDFQNRPTLENSKNASVQ
jgi:hypothetical protein